MEEKNERPIEAAEENLAPTAAPVNPPSSNQNKRLLKLFLLGGVTGIVVLVVALIGLFALGIYKWGWSGAATDVAIKAFPYPAALVNNHPVSYAEFIEDIRTLERFYAKMNQRDPQNFPIPEDEEIRQNVMDRLIQTELLREVALKYDVSVTSEDIDEEYDAVAGARGGDDVIEEEIADLYGWTVDEFKKKVLEPYLLQEKVSEALATDETFNQEARDKAQKVMDELTSGGDFAALAAQYSDDIGSASRGGELGWFPRGVMVSEFEAAAFSLAPGEVSGLVKTQFGYHIIEVEDNEEEEGEVTEVQARHILIQSVDVEDYFQKLHDEAKIRNFVN